MKRSDQPLIFLFTVKTFRQRLVINVHPTIFEAKIALKRCADEQHAMTAAHCLDGRFPDMPFRVVIGASERGSDSNGTDSDREDTVNIAAAYLVRHRIKLQVTVIHSA